MNNIFEEFINLIKQKGEKITDPEAKCTVFDEIEFVGLVTGFNEAVITSFIVNLVGNDPKKREEYLEVYLDDVRSRIKTMMKIPIDELIQKNVGKVVRKQDMN